ncbi:MAG: RimK family alpha-L-glutamate ligase, partial [Flavobacteriaceae bacterium]|nr:RimK family alpha-L-glutamate ligase [Flavobacteriaceae bacterium]
HSKATSFDSIAFPLVIKIPDGSFSRGMYKAENRQQLEKYSTDMLKKSEIILCQEFVESEFDWRIGILDKQPLFAVQYFMAKGHWQIYNHQGSSKAQKTGGHRTVPLHEVPPEVLEAAIKVASLIGNSLYGVDLKQTKNGDVVVIEVNDNPNIDSGIEDAVVGNALYQKILEHLVKMIEA